jgi:hypothetical protein
MPRPRLGFNRQLFDIMSQADDKLRRIASGRAGRINPTRHFA